MTKENPCKGTGPAKGFGCKKKTIRIRYGLGSCCLGDFLYGSPEGLAIVNKTTLSAKKKVKKEKEKEEREQKRKAKEAVKKKSAFEADLQREVNTIVRLIDHDKGCISCNHGWETAWKRKAEAGHRISVGSDATLRYHFHNIFLQCTICNNWKSANEREYDKGLIKHYGPEYLEKINGLKALYPLLKLSIPELKEKIVIARQLKRDILNGTNYTREELNNKLGIYK